MKSAARILHLICILALIAGVFAPAIVPADSKTTYPFQGVIHIHRTETSPRPLNMHIVLIDLKTTGIRFLVTPHSGTSDTIKETTLHFLTARRAQIAINAHFFEPWPAPARDTGAADLVGLAASNGDVYSPFDSSPPKPTAIRPNAPALNIDANNNAAIVHRNQSDPSGRAAAEPVILYNAISGNKQILTAGADTTSDSKSNNTLAPRTIIGLTGSAGISAGESLASSRPSVLTGTTIPTDKPPASARTLVLFTVDGRQKGVSEGMTSREAASLLHSDYGVTDAINLDGGGSTTLCFADPKPRVVNLPCGIKDGARTLRSVGSNLAVFAPELDAKLSPTTPH
ncbi:MAG: phosphodiester glycosidase family protein [Candidatus Sumerlaeota bacterium]|nr:phosphodiester glycosidase family protein [Candidatus Sumerlaeota bacterium]